MKPSQIKTECELIYTQIKSLENRLKRLRSICKHPDTFEGNYSYRVGSMCPATICIDCGEVVSNELVSPEWEKLADINRKEI